jgi:uncharacterized protein with von Willebrand factor type A (vWA) domain
MRDEAVGPTVFNVERDVALAAVAFGNALHRAGVPTTTERAGRFASAIALAAPATVDDLYWVARATLVLDHAQYDTFDRVFAQVFRGVVDLADYRGDAASPPPAHTRPESVASVPPSPPDADDDQEVLELPIAAASREERLAHTDFGDLSAIELAELRRRMRALRIDPPLRPGRRPRRDRHGDRLDLRATVRRARRTGGDPVAQVRLRRRPRPRRLVVLLDISASMDAYARAYIQFLHAAAGATRAEVFTFATRLTRLTRALALRHPHEALARAAAEAPDWSGGTRIGEALKRFLDEYGRRGLARGAVVVIVSDGWERDDPAQVALQMERLNRLAHRVVWVNPRRADPRYQPLAGGMAAALPYCDALISGHSAAALDEVVSAIR